MRRHYRPMSQAARDARAERKRAEAEARGEPMRDDADCRRPCVLDLRHTAASQMVSAGVDLGTVGAVLGHKSAQTTKRYAHYAVPRLAEALKRRG